MGMTSVCNIGELSSRSDQKVGMGTWQDMSVSDPDCDIMWSQIVQSLKMSGVECGTSLFTNWMEVLEHGSVE